MPDFVRCLSAGMVALGLACGGQSSSTDASSASSSGSSGDEPSPSTTDENADDTSTDEATSAATSLDTSDTGSSTGSGAGPLASDDVFETRTDEVLVVEATSGVLANDADPAGGVLTVVDADAQTERGVAIDVDVSGAFTYAPPAGDWGPDSFGYTVVDAEGGMASATVTINVTPTAISLDEIVAGHGGFVIDGGNGDQSGYTVAGAGDVDGDGLEDLLVGAPYADATWGRVDVVFGKTDLDNVALSDIADGTGGFRMHGDTAGLIAGTSLSAAGDVNGDGLADILVGTQHYAANGDPATLRAYVVFGKDGDTEQVDLVALADDDAGFVLEATAQAPEFANDQTMTVAGAGDVNGDALADILVGIESAPATGRARAWVVFGKDDTEPVDLDALAASDGGFVLDGEAEVQSSLFRWLAGAGDVDGDGLDDVIVGLQTADVGGVVGAGRCYVVRGKADTDPVDLADLADGTGGFVIQGSSPSEGAGAIVDAAGDVNGDGLADIVLGKMGDYGPSYVVHGKADTEPVLLSMVEGGEGGFVIDAGDSPYMAHSLAGGRDIDGDGLDDVVLGEPFALGEQGHVFVVYGKTDTEAVDYAQIALGNGGFVVYPETSTNTADAVGLADTNGDLLADLLVGTSNPTSMSPFAGRTYVVSGTSTAPYR